MKHAILVMTHSQPYILERCMRILDSDDVDFFIHIDAKSRVDFSCVKTACSRSHVFFVDKIPVYWADYSQIKAEFILLNEACKKGYDRYHLISGTDLPLKTAEYFINFFSKSENCEKEFVRIFTNGEDHKQNSKRVAYSCPLIRLFHRTGKKWIDTAQKILFTRILRFPRGRSQNLLKQTNWHIYVGENWFSITHRLASQLIANQSFFQNMLHDCYTADELFVITYLMNNPSLSDKQSNIRTRLIDWSRGKPYTWRFEDINELMNSECLFARKFDEEIDKEVIDEVFSRLMANKA